MRPIIIYNFNTFNVYHSPTRSTSESAMHPPNPQYVYTTTTTVVSEPGSPVIDGLQIPIPNGFLGYEATPHGSPVAQGPASSVANSPIPPVPNLLSATQSSTANVAVESAEGAPSLHTAGLFSGIPWGQFTEPTTPPSTPSYGHVDSPGSAPVSPLEDLLHLSMLPGDLINAHPHGVSATRIGTGLRRRGEGSGREALGRRSGWNRLVQTVLEQAHRYTSPTNVLLSVLILATLLR
ncbi:hypothetical protein BV25DRAFT_1922504 [Artomyces pyxidatus]|uniref:Uncharacterized protein n=1 Tax=Artomyces pyxidatus TaxID=48021 RepID=A0ACB8SFH1_9AGAM|nr:hypothetical protein BV25DRAFT_1922504 [Artomyces pyxidatus]